MIRLRPTSNTNDACRGWARKEAQRSALEGYAAWFATASSSSSTRSGSSSGKGRSYLERWAGIRSTKQSSGSGAALQAPSPSTSTPPVSFFGRTYLLSTVKVPPFPAKAPPRIGATPTRPANGAAVSGQGPQAEEEEEEERVFEWMRAALNGPGAFGSTGFFPGAGAPIVLDLGAVAQDGSPHGRPASRASLAGAARAVRAAGLVPVGVCNTSHDVLRLASEQGLPEVMMVQARPRSSRQSSAPVTASTLPRKPPAAPSPSTRRRASSAERPAESAAAATVAAAAPSQTPPDQQQQQEQQQQQQQHRYSAAAGVEKPPQAAAAAPEPSPAPAEACGGRAGSSRSEPHGAAATAAADASEEGRDSSSGAVDGPGDQEADRETMVYQGSVRSGQQVFAEGASLVVLGAVSSGGEVMADGDIHVYGTLRGRALAGLSGNKSAKIFATRFDAELVGVGDTFTTCDDPDNLAGLVVDTPTNVCLRENKLVFQSFDLSASGGT